MEKPLHRVTAAISDAVDLQQDLTGAIVDLTTRTSENTQQVSARITEVNKAAGGVLQLSTDAHRCADDIATLLNDLLQGSVRKLESLTASDDDVEARGDMALLGDVSPLQDQKPGYSG